MGKFPEYFLAVPCSTFDADVVFFDPSSRARVILEVSIVTIGSDTSLGRGARAGLDGVNAQLRAREEDKRNHSAVQRLLNEAGNYTIITGSEKLMHSWGFALREGVFAENNEGICRNEVKKASF